MLLAGATSAIQIDQEAPDVLFDTESFRLLSLADDDSTRIFQSDGTQAGTIELADIPGTVLSTDIYDEVGGRLIFRASQPGELWSTDGTPGGTQRIADLSFDAAFAESGLFQDRLYIAADGGDGVELWATDGTAAGTVQIADINTGGASPEGFSFSFAPIAEAVSYDLQLFKARSDLDGVISQTDDVIGSASDVVSTTVTVQPSEAPGSITYLEVTPKFADGSQGAVVTEIVRRPETADSVSSHPNQFTVFDGDLWFAAETPAFGREWWKSDGTTAGTELAVDVFPGPAGSYPVKPLEFDQQLFFGAYHNGDLYRTDGTSIVHVASGTGVNHVGYPLRPLPGRSVPQLQAASFPIAILNDRLIVQQGDGGGESGSLRRLLSLESATADFIDLGAYARRPFDGTDFQNSQFFQGFTELNGRLVFRRTTYGDGRDPSPPDSDLLSTDGLTTSVLITTILGGTNLLRFPKLFDTMGPVSGNELKIVTAFSRHTYFAYPGTVTTDGTPEGTTRQSSETEEPRGVYGFLGDRTFHLRTRPDESRQGPTDLYQIEADGQSVLVEADTQTGTFVNFGDQLFIRRQVDGGHELAVVTPLIFEEPLTITAGTGQSQDSTPTLQWESRGSQVARYDLYINKLSDRGSSVYRRSALASAQHTVEEALADGSYEVWVRAIYTDGQRSRWGTSPALLTIGDTVADDTPISVTGGVGQQTTATPTLSWSDSGFDVDRYDVYINRVGDRSTASYREKNVTSTTHTVQTVLANGEYEVWLRVFYSGGTVSRWGASPVRMTVNAGPSSSGPPSILTPQGTTLATRPEFTWTATTGAQSYEIWVSSNMSPTPLINNKGITGQSFTPDTDLPVGTYGLWVRANLLDGKSDWSARTEFFIGRQGQPILNVSGGVVAWEASTGATRYELWVDEVDENGNQTHQKSYHNTQLTSLEVDLTSQLSTGNYKAWLRVINGSGATAAQSQWSRGTLFTLS